MPKLSPASTGGGICMVFTEQRTKMLPSLTHFPVWTQALVVVSMFVPDSGCLSIMWNCRVGICYISKVSLSWVQTYEPNHQVALLHVIRIQNYSKVKITFGKRGITTDLKDLLFTFFETISKIAFINHLNRS